MDPVFDRFQALNRMSIPGFVFVATRYELWDKGKLTKAKNSDSTITCTLTVNDAFVLEIEEPSLETDIAKKQLYDLAVSQTDRLQLVILPSETNLKSGGLASLTMFFGTTRAEKEFKYDEPYCCNLFFQQGYLVKVTFSYGNPDRLLEFYTY